jgi:hypothetical protein
MDDDDKIRRNLVVFSTGVLLVAWFNVPVQGWLEDTFKYKPQVTFSPAKTWLAAAAILIYLLLRYRFSEDGENLVQRVSVAYAHAVGPYAKTLVVSEALAAIGGGVPSRIVGGDVAGTRDKYQELCHGIGVGEAIRLTILDDPSPADRWSGRVSLVALISTQDGGQRDHTFLLPFSITGWLRAKCVLVGTAKSVFYSKASINHLVPVALAVAAAVVILWKLAVAST